MPAKLLCNICQDFVAQTSTVGSSSADLLFFLQQDCVTLPDVKKSLRQGVDLHSESCHSVPSFAVVDQVGVKNLLMSCQVSVKQDNCDETFFFRMIRTKQVLHMAFTGCALWSEQMW